MNKKIIIGFAIFFALFIGAINSYAEEKGIIKNDEGIKPPEISGTGVIDRIDTSSVLLGDKLYVLSPNYEKRTADNKSSSDESLKKGMTIAFQVNDKKEIVKIWVIKNTGL